MEELEEDAALPYGAHPLALSRKTQEKLEVRRGAAGEGKTVETTRIGFGPGFGPTSSLIYSESYFPPPPFPGDD